MAGKLEIDLTMVSSQWREMLPNVEKIVRRVAEHAWTSVDVATDGEVSLLMSNDAVIRFLNREHRGKDQPTVALQFLRSTCGARSSVFSNLTKEFPMFIFLIVAFQA